MELGKKILKARQEAGLSQRALCGDEITRNMLSLIENGNAKPSMDTLQYLASRLEKPVSYFLDEDAVISPNQESMLSARQAYLEGKTEKARLLLENYRSPDPIFGGEYRYLKTMTTLAAAEDALDKGKDIYARELLSEIAGLAQEIPGGKRQYLLLSARLKKADLAGICRELPSIDEDLLVRARACMEEDPVRAGQLLDAMEEQDTPRWNLLRGRAFLNRKQYPSAAECFHRAEKQSPEETAPLLEQCYRELGDYKRAYEYALKQR